MSNARRYRVAPRVAFIAALLGLSACSGGAMIGQLPESVGGLPASAPQRPAETMPFPNVYEPRPRETKTLSDAEQKKLESELSNLRDAQNKRASPPAPPEPKAASKTATKAATKTATKSATKAGAEPSPKERPKKKKMADKPKPKAAKSPEKKSDDTLVPEPKGGSSSLKLMN